jgi:hypothetical protein
MTCLPEGGNQLQYRSVLTKVGLSALRVPAVAESEPMALKI